MSADKNKFETGILTILLNNLEIFSKSPNGIDKLRELIIEQAVRGKLVPQNNNDEPASTLVERIILEKSILLKDKKIKKTKALLDVSSEDIPFDIPNTWKWARLGNIGNIFNGNSISVKVKQEKYTDIDGLPYIATKDVGYGFDNLNYNNGISIPPDEPKFKTAKKSSILICAEGGSAGKKCGITDQVICFGNKLYANEPYCGIHSKYILYVYLSPSFKHQFSEAMTGIIGGISLANFNQLLFQLPPLKEQKRIITKVEELMTLCDKLEEQQQQQANTLLHANTSSINALLNPENQQSSFDKNWQRIVNNFYTLYGCTLPMPETTGRKKKYLVGLENLQGLRNIILQMATMGKVVKQYAEEEPSSILLENTLSDKQKLIGKGEIKKVKELPPIKDADIPFDLPDGWEWCRIWDIAELITSGSRGWAKYYSDSGAKFITMGNLSRNNYKLRLNTIKYVSIPESGEGHRTKLRENDLLISITGDVGNLALIPSNFGEAYINQHTCLLRFMPLCQSRYFVEYMRSPFAKYQFNAPQRGIKNSFRLSDIGEMLVPVPPLKEQERIVAKIDKLMELCDKLEQQLTQSYSQAENLMEATVKALVA